MFRISLGLVSLLLSLLLVARAANFAPDPDAIRVEKRAAVCNGLAMAAAVGRADEPAVAARLVARVAELNPDAVSAAVRVDGRLVAATAGHDSPWAGHDPGRSTPTHLHAPLARGGVSVGQVEV